MNNISISRFQTLCIVTLVVVYMLIGMGSFVRSFGAGMGCPDWPTCFGSWIPPTSVDQLPANYKEHYSAYRLNKNKKFGKFLRLIGLSDVADKLESDEQVNQEIAFNATHTWVEYANRLLGALVGLLMILLTVFSFPLRKSHTRLFFGSVLALLITIFQGWFGSIVVSTNLTPWTINIHLALALLIVSILVFLITHVEEDDDDFELPISTRSVILSALSVIGIQIFLGVQVRESLEQSLALLLPRNTWIKEAGDYFILHRGYAWIAILVTFLIYLNLKRFWLWSTSFKWLVLSLCFSIGSGIIMAYFSVPIFSQPIHLMFASISFSLVLMMYWNTKMKIH